MTGLFSFWIDPFLPKFKLFMKLTVCANTILNVVAYKNYVKSMLDPNPTQNLIYNAAPSAPRNVTAINMTRSSITISWLAPDPTNGNIESYSIEATSVDNGQIHEIERTIGLPMAAEEMVYINITGLLEYVNYSIIVFASTDKGRGSGSEPIVVQTLEHRE